MPKFMVSGLSVEPVRRSMIGGSPPYVILHNLGTDENSFLTPREARELADSLMEAAKEAEEK
jgi:predicted regulator of Ras-like GTPase activity (Roadblock/LC7/MglB family)